MTESSSSSLVEALRQFDSPTIANAIEAFAVRDPVSGYATMDLHCQFPERPPMVGYAITCTADSTTPGDTRPLGLDKLVDAVHAAPKPSVLVVEHVGAERARSCFVGDMFCTWLEKLGGVGVVTDGGYRDGAGIAEKAPGVQLFAGGAVVSHGHGAFLDFDVTVSICGLTISPGELLHGDANGLVTIPAAIAGDVVEQAAKVRAAESSFFEFINGQEFSAAELKRRLRGREDDSRSTRE